MAGLLTPAPIDAVADELRRWAREPFDLAHANCGQSVIGYVGRVKGYPVPFWLRTLGRVGALRLMQNDAAMEAAVARGLSGMDCPVTDAPQRGDVGVVRFPGSPLTTAICTGPLWAARCAERGIVIQAATVVKAWGVSCPAR